MGPVSVRVGCCECCENGAAQHAHVAYEYVHKQIRKGDVRSSCLPPFRTDRPSCSGKHSSPKVHRTCVQFFLSSAQCTSHHTYRSVILEPVSFASHRASANDARAETRARRRCGCLLVGSCAARPGPCQLRGQVTQRHPPTLSSIDNRLVGRMQLGEQWVHAGYLWSKRSG